MLASVAITYVLPATAQLVLDPEVKFRCPTDRSDVWAHFAIAVACIVFGAMAASRSRRRPTASRPRSADRPSLLLIALILAGAAAGLASLASGTSVRYGSTSLADRFNDGTGAQATATIVLQALVPLIPWWLVLRCPQLLYSRSRTATMTKSALALAVAVCINGLSSAMRATVAIALVAFPSAFRGFLFAAPPSRGRRRGALTAALFVAGTAVTLAAAGMWAKTGSTGNADTWSRYVEPSYLIGRNSVHFQHAMGSLEVGIDEGDRTEEFFDRATIAWTDAMYRIGVLTGNPAWGPRPDPASLSLWTAERFALFDTSGPMARSGSSPSIIGAFALSLPPPLSFAAMAAFAWALVRWLDWLLAGLPRLSWIGCAIIAFGPLRILTDTPNNLPNPFGIPFIVVALATVARLLSSYAAVDQSATAHPRPS
jgi:hypothetical protein